MKPVPLPALLVAKGALSLKNSGNSSKAAVRYACCNSRRECHEAPPRPIFFAPCHILVPMLTKISSTWSEGESPGPISSPLALDLGRIIRASSDYPPTLTCCVPPTLGPPLVWSLTQGVRYWLVVGLGFPKGEPGAQAPESDN